MKEKTTTPSNPSTPSNPTNPENPDNPTPSDPENPNNPDIPDNPENPSTSIPVESVTIDGGNRKMKIGESAQLKVTINPNNATNQKVTWKLSKKDVVTIDENGNIKAIKEGKVTITVIVDGKKATIEIEVSKIPVESLTVNPNNVTLYVGESKKIDATVTPENATYKTVTWKSENENVATVDSDGTIHAIRKGTTKIIAIADGKTAEVTVTVNDKYELHLKEVRVEGLSETFQYRATIKKNNKDFTDWLGFTLNEQDYIRKDDPSKQTVSNPDVKENNSATITLNDESEESLIVIID